jgi:hypothetical protein
MSAFVKIKSSTFTIKNTSDFRAQPEKAFEHRLKTRDHLAYLETEKLFDVSNSRWAKKTIDGEVCYGHEYMGCLFTVRLKTANGRFNLSHNEDGAFDRHLLNNPEEHTVYSITSSNNGLESTHTFNAMSAGMASAPIICVLLVLSVALANSVSAAQAATAAALAAATVYGVNVTVVPIIGIVIAILGFIGVWIAEAIGREIILNLIYENRSKKIITLVDHAVYNIGDNPLLPATLKPPRKDGIFEFYDDVVVCIDNDSKYRGIGVSMRFQREDESSLVICIRQDIYKDPHYTIVALPKGDKTSAAQIYDNCTSGDLVTEDFRWGNDLLVKNRLDPQGFKQYKFAGIIAFNDAV